MKPIQVVLLVVVGAIGGALVMKVTHRPADVPVAAAIPQTAPPVTAPAPPAEALPVAVEPAKPSPVEAPKPARVKVLAAKPAKNEAPPPVSLPEPVKETAAAAPPPPLVPVEPEPIPPARSEPDNVTPAARLPEPHMVTLNAGTLLPVRLVDGLSSERNLPGDTFTANLDKELVVDGFVIAERGARVEGKVVAADRGGKVKGVAALAVELTRLRTADGQNIVIQTDSFERRAQDSHTQDATKVGGGAALGAIIGAIAGGGKGAAVGAAAGGAAGAGGVLLTRGEEVRLTSETRINFRLRTAVTVTERR